jgi:hypothetical protein
MTERFCPWKERSAPCISKQHWPILTCLLGALPLALACYWTFPPLVYWNGFWLLQACDLLCRTSEFPPLIYWNGFWVLQACDSALPRSSNEEMTTAQNFFSLDLGPEREETGIFKSRLFSAGMVRHVSRLHITLKHPHLTARDQISHPSIQYTR